MKRTLLAGAAALALATLSSGAHAVDVVNHDQMVHELQITIDWKDAVLEVPAGQTLKDICEKCSLSLDGEESFDLSGDQVAMIRNGKLKIE
jgi:hypothetical protein